MNLKKVYANQNLGQDISRKHNDPVEVGTGGRMGSDDGEETEAGTGVGWGGVGVSHREREASGPCALERLWQIGGARAGLVGRTQSEEPARGCEQEVARMW